MKKVLIAALFLVSIPVMAAKVKDPKCSDVATVNESVTPEYLAVIDGYDKAGKRVDEEIDLGDIVSESKKVNAQCAKDRSAKLKSVRNEIKNAAADSKSSTTINPTRAKCEDFIALQEEVQPVAVYWVAGHDKSGKVMNGEVDEEYLERPVASLVEDCKAQPTASFYDKTKAWLKKKI